jgi:3-isopropylmalate/(R)-2-methylmalate dehydratase large subunit
MMRDLGLKVAMPHRTFATVDHIVPTDQAPSPTPTRWPTP